MGRVTEEFCDRCGAKLDSHAHGWLKYSDYKTYMLFSEQIEVTNIREWDLCPECAKSLNAWLQREVEMRG